MQLVGRRARSDRPWRRHDTGGSPAGATAFAHSTIQRTRPPAILGDLKLIEHKNYASLTNDMCPRFNLSADYATIEELAKERRADLDDARRQPAKAAGADPPVR
jgi:hypothetical protein